MSPEEIASRAREGTARLIEIVRTMEGEELDVGGYSLGRLDDLIDARRDEWKRDLTPAQLDNLQRLFASYLGECFVQRLGGQWGLAGEPAVMLRGTDGDVHIVFPFSRVKKRFDGEEGSAFLKFFVEMAALAGKITPVERDSDDDDDDDDDDEGFVWEEPTVIVGPWSSREACDAKLREVLDARDWRACDEHARGRSIARGYEIAGTFWLSVDSELAPELVEDLDSFFIFGVIALYGESGNSAEGVELWQLDIDEDGTLYADTLLGEEDDDRDALDAALDWETKLAIRAIEAPIAEPEASWMIYYDETT